MSDIQPFGTSSDTRSLDGVNTYGLKTIKAFGCTVVSFDISADWASQAGKLSMTLIEDEADGDRLKVPVIGSPYIFELQRDDTDEIIFEHIGIVESISRSASVNSKTYTATIASPLRILEAAQVILNGYAGLGAAMEGSNDFSGYGPQLFGHLNATIAVDNNNGYQHWFNVSNVINAFGILENEDPNFRVPRNFFESTHGGFGYSAATKEGMPILNLFWALHIGINHMPRINSAQGQQTHGGNLLYGRQNYDLNDSFEGIPYFYDFDALGFFNQVVNILGPEYRYPGDVSSINEIIKTLCNDANLEYFVYIDIGKNEGFGDPTLREDDPNWPKTSNCSWPNLDLRPFTEGGHYGGTIRVQTVNKNAFFNRNRPFSDISYNLLGLEVPDLVQTQFTNNEGVHPGKRPGGSQAEEHGLASDNLTYSDPLDSKGLDNADDGWKEVGTKSIANGGEFPTKSDIFDASQMDKLRITDSNLSLQAADTVTMKVVTGGYQSRLVHVPRDLIKCYWGSITLINGSRDLRSQAKYNATTIDAETDDLGVNSKSTRKIPVVTQQLDPADIDDFIFIDMQSIFGNWTIPGVIYKGIYAAAMLEIRLAMNGFDQWYSWWKSMKKGKYNAMINFFYPDCINMNYLDLNKPDSGDMKGATNMFNNWSGLGYGGVSVLLNCTNPFTTQDTLLQNMTFGFDCSGNPKEDMPAPSGGCVLGHEDSCFPTGLFQANISCAVAEKQLAKLLLPAMQEKIKQIGDTHYGKSWYVPVPFMQVKEDLDANALVSQYKYSWECTDSAYVEPVDYYRRRIPQTSNFLQDGKVQSFVNYKNDFVFPATEGNALSDLGKESYPFDESYLKKLESPFDRQEKKVFNFSEYSFDELSMTSFSYKSREFSHCVTGVGYGGVGQPCSELGVNSDGESVPIEGKSVFVDVVKTDSIVHAKPEKVNCEYTFLPYAYQYVYNRFLLPFSDRVPPAAIGENPGALMYDNEAIVTASSVTDSAAGGTYLPLARPWQATTYKTFQLAPKPETRCWELHAEPYKPGQLPPENCEMINW